MRFVNRLRRHAVIVGVAVVAVGSGAALAVAAIAPPAASAQTPPDGPAGDILDLATYRVVTTLKEPDGKLFERSTPALVAVPALVNVHRSALSLPDLTVLVVPLPGLVSLQVVKLPLAPALRVKVELVIDLPGASERKLAVGYDTLDAEAPAAFGATASFSLTAPLIVDVRTAVTRPGHSMAVLGSLFERGADGSRVNPKSGRIQYTPVPENGRLRLETAALADKRTIDVHVETDRRVTGVITASDSERATETGPATEQRLTTTITGLPREIDVGLDLPKDNAAGRLEFDYSALERAETVHARGTKLVASATELDVLANVTKMSKTLNVVKDGTSRVTLDTDAPIDQVDVAFAKDAEAAFAPAGAVPADMRHFALTKDADDPDSLAQDGIDSAVARVVGLQHAEFDLADPLIVDVELTPGPFFVRAERGPEPMQATVRDLPAKARIELDKPVIDPFFGGVTATALDYTGTDATGEPASIGEIVADMDEPDGFPGALERARNVHALLRGLPSGLSFRSETARRDKNKLIELSAGGQTVDLAEVTVSDGQDLPAAEQLPATHDGVLFRDLTDIFHVFARVTGLRKVTYEQKGSEAGETDVKDAFLDAVGDPDAEDPVDRKRHFRIDVKRTADSEEEEEEFVTAEVERLAPATRVHMGRIEGGVKLRYEAAASIPSTAADLRFQTNLGAIELLRGTLDPLPAGATEACFSKSARCIPTKVNLCYVHEGETTCVGGEGTLSASFSSRSPITANVFICEDRPEDVECSLDENKATFTDIRLRSVENVQFKFLSHKGEGRGNAFVNTEDPDKPGKELLSGVIRRHEPNKIADGNADLDLTATFSPVFWANNRFVRFNGITADVIRPKFGEVECGPAGETEIKVTISGLPTFDLGDRICKD